MPIAGLLIARARENPWSGDILVSNKYPKELCSSVDASPSASSAISFRKAVSFGNARWEIAVGIIVSIGAHAEADLAQIASAHGTSSFLPRLVQCWQKHGGKNADDGNHH